MKHVEKLAIVRVSMHIILMNLYTSWRLNILFLKIPNNSLNQLLLKANESWLSIVRVELES